MPSPRLGPADVAKRQAGARSDPLDARAEAVPRTSIASVCRILAILEPLIVFGFVMLYIWELRAAHPDLWMAILGLMLLSHLLRREGYDTVGLGRCKLQNL